MKEKIIKRYRNEWKYCEKERELFKIKQRLSAILEHDSNAAPNGIYGIHSMYFDDYKDICARENVAGEGIRFKYRIRYYGNDSNKLWLEKKEKKNSYCYKQKCALSVYEYQAIMEGRALDVFWNTKEALLKEFCINIVARRFMPRVIISYEREAFVEIISNIRITLDYNISASDEFGRFLSGDYLKTAILDREYHVLEVKFDEVLPSYIKSILQVSALGQQSFSKYYLGRITMQKNKNFCKNL